MKNATIIIGTLSAILPYANVLSVPVATAIDALKQICTIDDIPATIASDIIEYCEMAENETNEREKVEIIEEIIEDIKRCIFKAEGLDYYAYIVFERTTILENNPELVKYMHFNDALEKLLHFGAITSVKPSEIEKAMHFPDNFKPETEDSGQWFEPSRIMNEYNQARMDASCVWREIREEIDWYF